MRRSILGALGASLIATVAASGQIRVWHAEPSDGYVLNQVLRRVTITRPGIYKIDALNQGGLGLGTIDLIQIDPYGPVLYGNVQVYVVRDPNYVPGFNPHTPGAARVKQVALRRVDPDHSAGLVECRLTADFGELGPIDVKDIDTCIVGGSLRNNLIADSVGTLNISGLLKASLTANSLGNLNVLGVGVASTTPNITVTAPYAHTMSVNQTVGTLALAGVQPGAVVEIPGHNVYNLAMPSAVLGGRLTIGNQLRAADIGQIAEGASLVAGQLGDDVLDHCNIGTLAGGFTVQSVYAGLDVTEITSTATLTVTGPLGGLTPTVIGSVESGGSIQLGALTGELEFTDAPAGTLHVHGDVSGILIASAGTAATSTVQIDGALSGQLQVHGAALAGALAANSVPSTGRIVAEQGISANVAIGENMAGSIEIPSGGNEPWSPGLSGRVVVSGDFTGQLLSVGPLYSSPFDPNVDLAGGVRVHSYAVLATGSGGSWPVCR